jgi:hypothetical protein
VWLLVVVLETCTIIDTCFFGFGEAVIEVPFTASRFLNRDFVLALALQVACNNGLKEELPEKYKLGKLDTLE